MTATRQRHFARWWTAAFAAGLCAIVSPLSAEETKPADDKVAPAITWSRADTMKGAAERIAALHRAQGPQGAYKFIDACYKTHGLASTYSEAFENCIVQDYLETKIMVGIYSQMPPDQLKKLGIPQPALIADAMGRRVVSAFATYKIPASFGDDLKRDADKYGAPAFFAVLAPKAITPDPSEDKKKQRN